MELTAKELTKEHIGTSVDDSPSGPGILEDIQAIGHEYAIALHINIGTPRDMITHFIAGPDEVFKISNSSLADA